jgi:hydroxymethylpyrimidine/phosphomethylpyrimidine kinase
MPTQPYHPLQTTKPVVLCISGLDPTGGAGIQADIETLFSLGCHGAPILSVLTVQTSENVHSLSAVDGDLIKAQAMAVLGDMDVACIKLGLLPSSDTIHAVHTILTHATSIPVVIDPVLIAGGGFPLSEPNTVSMLRDYLLPLATVVTPNTSELQALVPETADPSEAAAILLREGCKAVLLTGTHAESLDVENRLYLTDGSITPSSWPRLAHTYHGSGCTLASAVAAGLGSGLSLLEASKQAQTFTWQALQQANKLGRGQWFPNRRLA